MSDLPEVKKTDEQIEKVEDEGPKRFISKGPFVVYDTETGISWMKKDSWQDKGKFFNWHESRDYADTKNIRKIGKFDDWRLPLPDEVQTLFLKEKEKEIVGKGGVALFLDPVFPEGAFKTCWVAGDTSTKRPRFDFAEGKMLTVEEYSFGSVRLCRKDGVGKERRSLKQRR
jgi:hypothetical protein